MCAVRIYYVLQWVGFLEAYYQLEINKFLKNLGTILTESFTPYDLLLYIHCYLDFCFGSHDKKLNFW